MFKLQDCDNIYTYGKALSLIPCKIYSPSSNGEKISDTMNCTLDAVSAVVATSSAELFSLKVFYGWYALLWLVSSTHGS